MPAVKQPRTPTATAGTVPTPRGAAALVHRNLPLLLLQARESVLTQFRPILKAHGLTEQQWRVVRALVERGPLEPREIVEHCRLSSPSLAGVLARMETQGLVTRTPHAADRRRQTVAASARSLALADRIAPQIEQTYATLEAQLGPAFVRQLYAALDQLLDRFDGAVAGAVVDADDGGSPTPLDCRAGTG
ncbi:MAG: homoprotocatechuate degradation operon regulator HpaR [Rubrivivax sp.]